MTSYYALIDIGGTALKYGLYNAKTGTIEKRLERESHTHRGAMALMDTVKEAIRELAEENELAGICVSTAGMVDPETGTICFASDAIPGYTGTSVKAILESEFGIPCEVENDVNCAGLAEAKAGAARDKKLAVVITVGTGIGGCFIKDGEVYHGADNAACEVGYIPMEDSTWQALASAGALCRQVAAAKNELAENWNGKKIFEEYKKGDADCIKAVDDMCRRLGTGLATLCFVLNPEICVVGGGILAQEDILLPKIKASLNDHLLPNMKDKVELKAASMGNDAGMLGAYHNFVWLQDARKRRL